jgi:hypothetical protein
VNGYVGGDVINGHDMVVRHPSGRSRFAHEELAKSGKSRELWLDDLDGGFST